MLPLLGWGAWHFYLNVSEMARTLAVLQGAPSPVVVRESRSLALNQDNTTREMADFLANNKALAQKLVEPTPVFSTPPPAVAPVVAGAAGQGSGSSSERVEAIERLSGDWERDGGAQYFEGVEGRLAPETEGQRHLARLIAVRSELFAAGPELTQDRWAQRAQLQNHLVNEIVQAPDGPANLQWAFEKLKPGDDDLERSALFQAANIAGVPEPVKAVVANAVETEMVEWAQRVQAHVPGAENQLKYKLESLGMYARPETKAQMEALLQQAAPPPQAPGLTGGGAPEGGSENDTPQETPPGATF